MVLYIDPGTGSMIAQMIAAGFLSALFFFKRIKIYIFTLLGIKPKDKEIDDSE